MTRPRFTVRRLMLAVAVVGTVLGVTNERRNRFRRLRLIIGPSVEISLTDPPFVAFSNFSEAINRRIEWHHSMWLRYEDAARHPWLPVALDPPEPK